ncbi:DUF4037 domain-containing protein [Microlunatus speluncae]|uniref:DUF4037 domain-containing protein n=1 Tax=Microlunatus speluncae TaxID=2594267 RepID=UPI001C2D8272|nr:DUF4037 domain-containing protein [Microlunatus speluncae]
MPAAFLPGLELSRRYYREVVRPIVAEGFPELSYAAGLIGHGSEVLGLDTERSTDHDWGPRLLIFLADDQADRAAELKATVGDRLPETFLGFPTVFPEGTHRVAVSGIGDWLRWRLGFDPRQRLETVDWLSAPTQVLAEITGGAIFHDGLGDLGRVREQLGWYPDDLWRYLLACQWQRIGQEEAFPGRTAQVGDDLGSVIIAARLARDVVRLCLLMARTYPPYSKWLGSAFARLPIAETVGPRLSEALAARDWPARERHLNAAYVEVARAHNALELTEPLDPEPVQFWDRPFFVPAGERFTEALRATITDPALRRLPPIGAVDHFIDSTDAVNQYEVRAAAVAAVLRQAGDQEPVAAETA